MNLTQVVQLLRGYHSLPKVTITLAGSTESAEVFQSFTARHPYFPLVRRKEIGVALIELPAQASDFSKGKQKEYLRRRRNRAIRLGYQFRPFAIAEQIGAVLAVNDSLGTRQGRVVSPTYLDHEAVTTFHSKGGLNYGIFDANGCLVAYAYVPICGELAILSRLFGHGEHLDNGVMYLLISEVVGELLQLRSKHKRLRWLNYDMWFGAAPGLQFFKQQLGFSPYRVKWTWENTEPV